MHACGRSVWACACGCVRRCLDGELMFSMSPSNKTGRQAPCEPLDYIRGLQIDCKRIVVSTGKCC